MSLRIVRLAAGTTFQDGGRPGWRRFGVPAGGAFDRESYGLAVALVGRSEGPALEIPMLGGAFECLEEDHLAVVGAECSLRLDGRELRSQTAFPIRKGVQLEIGPPTTGVRLYLASARGWQLPMRLGSASGIEPGRQLSNSSSPFPHPPEERRLAEPPDSLRERPLRFVRGPQARPSDIEVLGSEAFKVGLQSNRVGLRLEGGDFEPASEHVSEPSCPGVIQVAPSGELLIHGPDGPTVGGYPKIGVVISADQDRLAQLRPMDEVRFAEVNLEEALSELAREMVARRKRLQQILIRG